MAKRTGNKVFGVPASLVGVVVCLLAVLAFGFSVAGALGTAGTDAAGTDAAVEDATVTDGDSADSNADMAADNDSSAADADAADVVPQSEDEGSAVADVDTDSDSYGEDIDPVTVYLRVLVDGAWKYVGKDGNLYDSNTDSGYEAITVTKQANRAGGDRAIIPASVLEGALAQFGFSVDSELKRADQDYTTGSVDWGNFVFGYCDSDTAKIYNDVSPQLVTADDGTSSWYVFTKGRAWIHEGTDDKSLDVFYLPANRNDGAFDTPSSFFIEGSRSKTDAQLIADNSFYSVTVSDADNRIYGADEARPSGYVNTNAGSTKRTFTVKKPTDDAHRWNVVAADG